MTTVISEKGGLMSAGKHQVSVIGIVVQFATTWSTANAAHQFRNLGAIMKLYYMVPLEGLQLCSVCNLAKIFFTSKFSYFFFYNPIIKLKLGQQIGGKPLIANHLDHSVWWANQKHWVAVKSYFLHSFLHVHKVSAHFTSHREFCNYVEPNQHVLTVLDPILLCKIIHRDALICTHTKNELKEEVFTDSLDTINSGALLQQTTRNPNLKCPMTGLSTLTDSLKFRFHF